MGYSKSISIMIVIFLLIFSFLFITKVSRGEYISSNTSLKLNEKIMDYGTGNIIGGEEEYLIVLTKSVFNKYGREVIIYSLSEEMVVYRKDISDINPWKIAIGDVDGDGVDDISIGAYKEAPLHPVMAKRPYIYSYIDGELEPKWRGSRLSRPFIDYVFFDIDHDGVDEIISIEILENDKKLINTYKWKGFGFEGFMESTSYDSIENLHITEEKVYVQVSKDKDRYLGLIELNHNNLAIERVK